MARVLVIDDDPRIREALRMLLEDAGHAVTLAESGPTRLMALRASQAPQVVLLDLLMPEMDGLALLHEVIQERQLAEQHGYILMTGDSTRLIDAAACVLSALPVTMARKPFDSDDVLKMM